MPATRSKNELDQMAVENFRTYLRIGSVHPNIDYTNCVQFIKNQAAQIGLEYSYFELVKNKPIVVLTWKGKDPKLPSILLNSHMDVVPVYPDLWKHDPFGAELDANGNIYARGSQDMKCVGIQYLEAIRRMKENGEKFERTIHLSFVPDEEIGGIDGMKKFVHTNEFKSLNVGFAMDEGMASADQHFIVFYAERTIWQIEFTISGTEGHGSLLLKDTAGEKLRRLIDSLMDFRQSQVNKLNSNPGLLIGDVTTVNLTMIKGGVEPNVVPPELFAVFDFRLAIDVDLKKFEEQVRAWMAQAGEGISMKFVQINDFVQPTKLDETNPYWMAIKKQFDEMKISFKKAVFPGGTDSRYCRELGIPVVGFSPMNNTPVLLHANDEFLNKDIFLKGIDIYMRIIPAIANLVCWGRDTSPGQKKTIWCTNTSTQEKFRPRPYGHIR